MIPRGLLSRLKASLFEGRARLFPDSGALPAAGRPEVNGLSEVLCVEIPRRAEPSKWLGPVFRGMERLVPVEGTDASELALDLCRGRAVTVGRLVGNANEIRFAIDILDRDEIYPEVLDNVGRYFKMQFRKEGYRDERVVPGGFPTAGNAIYGCLARLRMLRRQKRFEFDVHARFGLEYRPGLRKRAVELLQEDERLVTCARVEKRRYYQYLYELTRSKLCLDLPGNGAFCFRLVDYLAIGSCVIAYPHDNVLPEPLVDGHNVVYVKRDLSDLADVCAYYAAHDEERERIARNAARYFDRHLHREKLAAYYLRECLDAWSSRGRGKTSGAGVR